MVILQSFFILCPEVLSLALAPYALCTDARFTLGWSVCLWLSSQSRIFHSYGHVTITGEGLQNLSSAWHSIVAIEQ